MRDIFEVHIFREIAIFDAIFRSRRLMLAVKIFAEFGKAYGGEALLIESRVIASAQETVKAKNQERLHTGIVRTPDVGNVARQFARSRIAFAPKRPNSPDLSLARRRRQSFGKHPHNARVLPRAKVTSDNVVVQHGFDLPSLLLRHLGEMLAPVQSLLF